jgi:CRISPR-associated protein Cas1
VLFGSNSFHRDRGAEDQNRLLNYGYAVLRALTARAVCAAGLHPSLGIHHHNRYNAFCLADDLMEPFRVRVDQAVAEHVAEFGAEAEFGREARETVLSTFTGRCQLSGESCTLFDTLSRAANSLAAVFTGEAKELELPERIVDAPA